MSYPFMHAVRAAGGALVYVGCVTWAMAVGKPVHAQDAPAVGQGDDRPSAPDLTPAFEGEESVSVEEAIAAARRELEALAHLDVQAGQSASLPAELTSDAPARRRRVPLRTPSPSVAWLAGLKLPDFPVRWDDRLVELLTHYRESERGRAHIAAWLQRSGGYRQMIQAKLRAAGLPEDLLFVAMVESGFDVDVKSTANAVGMWQFVRPTAMEYGLRVDRWADQRRSPEHATDAAIAFFKDLHHRLGSWPLSLAAFNMGYGALVRAIRKYNTNDFWVLAGVEAGLPYETVTYVAKITACAIVARNPERFGLADLTVDAARPTTLVEVPGGVGLGRVARAARVPLKRLMELNPELKRRRLPPDAKTWEIRLPNEQLAHFQRRWPQLVAALPSHRKHQVRLGETLSDLAQMYGTSEHRLLVLNDMEKAGALRPGQVLVVPDVQPEKLAREGRPVVGVPPGNFAEPGRERLFYRVTPLDTLTEIARFFDVMVDDLRRWNDISPEANLVSGMYLQVFAPAGADLSRTVVLTPDEVRTLVVGTEEFFDYHAEQRNRRRIRYRVQPGDTLASVAERFGLSVGSIARINRFSRYGDLHPDSEIILYVPDDAEQASR